MQHPSSQLNRSQAILCTFDGIKHPQASKTLTNDFYCYLVVDPFADLEAICNQAAYFIQQAWFAKIKPNHSDKRYGVQDPALKQSDEKNENQ